MSDELSPDLEQLAETTRAILEFRDELAQLRAFTDQTAAATPLDPDGFETDFDEPEELVAAMPARPRLPLPVTRRPQTADPHLLTQQGVALAAQHLPEWNRFGDKVVERVQRDPSRFEPALATGDPGAVARSLASVYTAVAQSDATRAMKMAAQTASGASGRTEPVSDSVAEWNAIKNATPNQYWEPSR